MKENDKNRVKVTINGEIFYIKGNYSTEYIKKIAEYVDDKIEEISEKNSHLNFSKIALLVAFNLTDELFELQNEKEELINYLEEETKSTNKR